MLKSAPALRRLRPLLDRHPRIKGALKSADDRLSVLRHSAAERVPALIRPAPRQLTIAITAQCNLSCYGCRYGRDFMLGEKLPYEVIEQVLEDARAAGFATVRFYGGEPMLHPDLARMIEKGVSLGLDTYITTNATLLRKKADELFAAGLRWMTMGFYGVGEDYGDYTKRPALYDKMREGVAYVRDTYGDELAMQLNWVVTSRSCNLEALHEAWEFAREFNMYFHLDLVGETIPFFINGEAERLGFDESRREAIAPVIDELLRLHEEHPGRIPHSRAFLRSVPDWLILGVDMKVPCDAYQLVWIGADGSVKLCDVHFDLGNVHETRLKDLLFTPEHKQACRDGFKLKCPNCTCKIDSRIRKHGASLKKYRG